MTTSFNININDLQYILKQIKIAEDSSAAYHATPKTILQSIMDAYGVTAINAAQLPAGLRTVDGTFNNLIPGRDQYGAADNPFPRLTDPVFQTVDGPGMDFNGDGLIDVGNHNYGDTNGAAPGGIKSVADADPRLISNLIVDMSVSNPAAIAAFLSNPLSLEALLTEHGVTEANAEAWLTDPLNVAAANLMMKTIPNQSPDIGLSPGFNSWMTFFGQFFDHGLDLVTKGSNGTVYIPLAADDPLYDKGADGIANNWVHVTDGGGNPLYYTVDPTTWPAGGPPPPTTTVATAGWEVKFSDDGAGADGVFGTTDDRPNFMALTRATATIDANGIPQHENTTTSWIDQNQTYTSHASHQVFLREYALDANGKAVSTGRLIDGQAANGSLDGAIGNWGEVKAQATEMLGLKMNDFNVHNAPLLKTDQYGKFIAGEHGFAQVAVNVTIINTLTGATVSVLAPTFIEGVAGGLDINGLTTANLPGSYPALPALGANQAFSVTTIGTGHAFLNDLAHHAAPALVDHDHNPATAKIQQVADFDMLDANGDGVSDAADVAALGVLLTDANGDTVIDTLDLADVNLDGTINAKDLVADDHNALTYDNEMLDAHFVTGDGRGNENIALTSVHSIFHSEHNRLVDANKTTLLANAAGSPAGLALLNEWLTVDITTVPTTQAGIDALAWDGDRLFQAARFGTEMQYQHLVFEEFARRIQPMVDPFIFNSSPEIDPSIVAEFAHTVYRFGHSMLTGTVDRLDNNLDPVNGEADQASLLAAFLNPQMYVASGTTRQEVDANLIRALSRDVGNAMDEFIVPDVRSSLLGLPLDLAALNIARGRDTGIPSLNETRKQLYDATSLADIKPYDSWIDFAAHIKNPMSLINFIAAYGDHASITAATTLADKRAAAIALVDAAILGDNSNGAVDFLNGTGAYVTSLGGLNNVDLWIGGLAEANPEFGGMLGTTFNYVFEFQMEQLQFGDRMYYLTRTQGLNILNNLEPNTFSDLVMRNTALGDKYATHLNGALFVTPDYFLEMDSGIAQEDYNGAGLGIDPTWSVGEAHSILTPNKVMRTPGTLVFDDRGTADPSDDGWHNVGGTLRFTGGEHVVVGGTEGNDRIYTDKGIDTIWGDGGDDYINAGTESDDVFGGLGNDVIEDPFGDDVLRGNQGDDVITSARGADLLFGDEGKDVILMGQDAAEAFGGEGDDFILGGDGKDFLLGNEGNDWIEGGKGFDTIAGDNSELFFNSTIIGHDVLFNQGDEGDYDAESGDDIMGSGPSVFRYEGMFGFDWAIAKHDVTGVDFDMAIPVFTTIPNDILKDRFDQVEALSGWKFNDYLSGDDRGHKGGGSSSPDSVPTELFLEHILTAEGIARIEGLAQWMNGARTTLFGSVPGANASSYRDGNILMGGDGNDFLRGRGGYDILDGDAWLNVRIRIMVNGVEYSAESLSTDTTVMGQYAGKVFNVVNGDPDFSSPAFGGRSLTSLLLDRTIAPSDMTIVREIEYDTTPSNNIDTAFFQGTYAEYNIEGRGALIDLNNDGDLLDAGENIAQLAYDLNGDGFISVRDRDTGAVGAIVNGIQLSSRGNLTDDLDLLKNIEQLQFADQIVQISGPNNRATGTVTIADPTPFDHDNNPATPAEVSPYVGQQLSVTSVLYDADNDMNHDGDLLDAGDIAITNVTYEWQTTEVGNNAGWSTITTSANPYTVRTVDPGHVLRAVATFVDANGITERVYSAPTGNPTVALNVNENSPTNTVVLSSIPFSVDYDSLTGVDVDIATLYHEIDPAHTSGGRFTVQQNGVDALGNPVYVVLVGANGGTALDYETQDAFQIVDNQYQIVINSYSNTPANGGLLLAQRQFTIFLNNLVDGVGEEAPVNIVWNGARPGEDSLPSDLVTPIIARLSTIDQTPGDAHTYTLLAGSSPGFAVSSAGVVTALTSMSANSTYTLTIQSTDLLLNSITETFTIRTGASGVANVIGGIVTDDVMYGLSSNDTLTGNFGDDTLYGQLGHDSLDGGIGNDMIIGGTGNDNTQGGVGNDRFHYTVGDGNDIINGGADTDTIAIFGRDWVADAVTFDYNGTAITGFSGMALTSVEAVTLELFGVGTELRYNTNSSVNVDLTAGTASGLASMINVDNVRGGNGNDILKANTDVNVFSGGNGNDTLIAVVDDVRDTFNGNGGAGDTLDLSAYFTDLTMDTTSGIVLGSGSVNANNDVFSGIENFIGGGGNDTIVANGQANILTGGGGNDVLRSAGNNDTLIGGAGTDTLDGGTGFDTMTGGADGDTFDFNFTLDSVIGVNRDLITDFSLGDLIDLSTIDANTNTAGNSAFTFVGTGAFTAGGQIRYVQNGTDTIIQVNNNNNTGTTEMEIRLAGLHTLAGTDFIL